MKFYLFLTLPLTTAFTVPTARTVIAPKASTFALHAEANGAEKKVIVLGGDGFCGWPTSLYLSDQGHDVVIVDNLSRRNIDTELGCDSLTPIQSPDVSNLISLTGRDMLRYCWLRLSLDAGCLGCKYIFLAFCHYYVHWMAIGASKKFEFLWRRSNFVEVS